MRKTRRLLALHYSLTLIYYYVVMFDEKQKKKQRTFAAIALFLGSACCDVEVRITKGNIKGRTLRSRDGRRYHSFTGIPFAKPPIGDLRFEAPEPVGPCNGTLDATEGPVACVQEYEADGLEDCLYVNVYTPSTDGGHPVMFWIHGGASRADHSGPGMFGPDYFMDKNVVLVAANSRPGVLGKNAPMITDGRYLHGILDTALKLSSPVYFYLYDHQNEFSFNTLYGECNRQLGITHGDELNSLFKRNAATNPGKLNTFDTKVSKRMVDIWTRFATSEIPTVDGTENGLAWPTFNRQNQPILHINSDQPNIMRNPFEKKYEFRNNLPVLRNLNKVISENVRASKRIINAL